MTLSSDRKRAVIIEHVAAENDHDAARVIATYSPNNPIFEDVTAGVS